MLKTGENRVKRWFCRSLNAKTAREFFGTKKVLPNCEPSRLMRYIIKLMRKRYGNLSTGIALGNKKFLTGISPVRKETAQW